MNTGPSNLLRLRLLDVGEGDAILLILPGGKRAIVVDAFDGDRVVDALVEEEIDEVILFLSHSDNDHVLGVPYLLDNFSGDFVAFFYNRDRIDASLRSRYRTTLLALSQATQDMAARSATPPLSGEFNTNLNDMGRFHALFTPPVSVEVLHPAHHEQSGFIGTTTNDGAGVLRVTFAGSGGEAWHILLAADVQLMGLSCMMHRHSADLTKLQANVLKFPHHGAWPTDYEASSRFPSVGRRTMTEFLQAVDPQYVVLSVGYGNPHGHVVGDVFDAMVALRTGGGQLRRILCTQITHTCLPAGGSCATPTCAGDVEIRIGGAAHGGIEVLPRGTEHSRRIQTLTTIADAGCGHLL